MKRINVLLALLMSNTFAASVSANENEIPGPEARLSGTTIITADIGPRIKFYAYELGFLETRIRELSGGDYSSVCRDHALSRGFGYTDCHPGHAIAKR